MRVLENVRRRYFVRQAHLNRSSHYSEIKIKTVSSRRFLDAFYNEGGDFALQFEGTPTKLTLPWCNIINASKTIMLFGAPFSPKAVPFQNCFGKRKHSMHIISFASSLWSITVILVCVRCYVLHINKLGWMLPLPIWF